MRIGAWWLPLYTVRVLLGVAAALGTLWWRADQVGVARRTVLGGAWMIALVGLLGGRMGYVLGQRAYFVQHAADVWRLTRVGGFAAVGVWLGGMLGLAWWRQRTRVPGREAVILFAAAALLSAAGAWWGCAAVGCAWGREAWQVAPLWRWACAMSPDMMHVPALRYDVPLLGAVAALGLAIGSLWQRDFGIWALPLYGLLCAGLTLLRGDPYPAIYGVRWDTVIYGGLAVGGGLWSYQAGGEL